jgi:hypothetical protein
MDLWIFFSGIYIIVIPCDLGNYESSGKTRILQDFMEPKKGDLPLKLYGPDGNSNGVASHSILD